MSNDARRPKRNKATLGSTEARRVEQASRRKNVSQGQLGLENDGGCRLTSKNVNRRRTAYTTPSQIQKTGYLPVSQHPTRSKMRNKMYYGPQMAVLSAQCEPLDGSHSQRRGRPERRVGGIVDKRRSSSNVVAEKKLTISSVSVPKRSTLLCSPTTVPRAPDKRARRVNDEQDTEAQVAPRPMGKGRAGTSQTPFINGLLTQTRQRSPCDKSHVSHETTRLRVVSSKTAKRGVPWAHYQPGRSWSCP